MSKKVAYNAKWRVANPEKKRLQHYKERYGLTPAALQNLYEEQGRRCALCLSDKFRLCVDHCHETGIVRFLLCAPCNSYFGKIEADPTLVERLADYSAMARALKRKA